MMTLLTTIFMKLVLPFVLIFFVWMLPLMLVLELGTKK